MGPLPRCEAAAGRDAAPSTTLSVARFDGTWHTTVDCPPTTGADGYNLQFLTHLKDGVLHAHYGTEEQPGALALNGHIAADGTGSIEARGVIGNPKYAVNRIAKGTPYAYRATAHFEGTRGTATRVRVRPCTLTFVKQ